MTARRSKTQPKRKPAGKLKSPRKLHFPEEITSLELAATADLFLRASVSIAEAAEHCAQLGRIYDGWARNEELDGEDTVDHRHSFHKVARQCLAAGHIALGRIMLLIPEEQKS